MASKKLQDLYYTLELRDKQFLSETKRIQQQLNGMQKNTQTASKNMSNNFQDTAMKIAKVTAVVGTVAVALKKAFDLGNAGAKFNQQVDALESQFGMSADKVLGKLKEVSDGTISNQELILATNKAFALGVTDNVEDLAKLLEFARLRARALGLDTTQAFSDIVTGVGRGSPQILDNLGIVTKAWSAEAQATGQAVDATFLMKKVLEEADATFAKTGPLVTTEAERYEKLKVQLQNAKIEMGQLISKGILPLVEGLFKGAKWVGELFNRSVSLKNAMNDLTTATDTYNKLLVRLDTNRRNLNDSQIRAMQIAKAEAKMLLNDARKKALANYKSYQITVGTIQGEKTLRESLDYQLDFYIKKVEELNDKKLAGEKLNLREKDALFSYENQVRKYNEEILNYEKSIENLIQGASSGIRLGFSTIEDYAEFGPEIQAMIQDAVDTYIDPTLEEAGTDSGRVYGENAGKEIAKGIETGVKDGIDKAGRVMNNVTLGSANQFDYGDDTTSRRNDSSSIFNVAGNDRYSAISENKPQRSRGQIVVEDSMTKTVEKFKEMADLTQELADILGGEVSSGMKKFTSTVNSVSDKVGGLPGLFLQIGSAIFTVIDMIINATNETVEFDDAWKDVLVNVEKATNAMGKFNDKLSFAKEYGTDADVIGVMTKDQQDALDMLKDTYPELFAGVSDFSNLTEEQLSKIKEEWNSLYDSAYEYNDLLEDLQDVDVREEGEKGSMIPSEEWSKYQDVLHNARDMGIITEDEMLAIAREQGNPKEFRRLWDDLEEKISGVKDTSEGWKDILKDVLDINKDITGEMKAQNDLSEDAMIDKIRQMIDLGLLDVQNIGDIQQITGMLSGVGITGLNALSSLGDFGVTGLNASRAINVSNMTNVYNGVPNKDLNAQTNDQVNSAIEGV